MEIQTWLSSHYKFVYYLWFLHAFLEVAEQQKWNNSSHFKK